MYDSFSASTPLDLRVPETVSGICMWKSQSGSEPSIVDSLLVYDTDIVGCSLYTAQTVPQNTLFEFNIGLFKYNLLDAELTINFEFGYDPGESGPLDYFTIQVIINSDANSPGDWIVSINNSTDTYLCSVPGLANPLGKFEGSIVFEPFVGSNTADFIIYVISNGLVRPVINQTTSIQTQSVICSGGYPFNLFNINFTGSNTGVDYVKITDNLSLE